MIIKPALIFLVIISPAVTFAMNCAKAKYPAEKAVCNSTQLKALDEKLGKIFNGKIKDFKKSTPEQVEVLQSAQRQWIVQKDKTCIEDIECLKNVYDERLKALEKYSTQYQKPLDYFMVTFKSAQGANVDRDIQYPELFGSDFALIKKLNHLFGIDVPERKLVCEGQSGRVRHIMKVENLTTDAFYIHLTSEIFCNGIAKPENGSMFFAFNLKDGTAINFWKSLPSEVRTKFIDELTTEGQKQTKGHEACKGTYEPKDPAMWNSLRFSFDRGLVIMTLTFDKAYAECETKYSFNATEFAKNYQDETLRKIVLQLSGQP